MPMFLFIVIIGAAAGFFATRMMRIQTDVPTTVALGVAGAAVGWVVLRFLVAITGWVAVFVGAVVGATLLIWAWQTWGPRR